MKASVERERVSVKPATQRVSSAYQRRSVDPRVQSRATDEAADEDGELRRRREREAGGEAGEDEENKQASREEEGRKKKKKKTGSKKTADCLNRKSARDFLSPAKKLYRETRSPFCFFDLLFLLLRCLSITYFAN